jgi:hypothetical protein
METPLRLYDQRLFTLLMGLRRSPLLSLLGSDIFKLILARCGKWQTCTRIKQDALNKWLQFENRSLLIMQIKKYCYEAPTPEQVWHPTQWQLVYTPREMVFELHRDEQLIASGPLRWCTSITFAMPVDDTRIMFAMPADDDIRIRAYFRLQMGPMGSRPTPQQPIRAHAGLIASSPQQPIRANSDRIIPRKIIPCIKTIRLVNKKMMSDYKKKRSGYVWVHDAERALSLDEVVDDEWCTVLSMQDFRLRVRWV